MKAAKKVVWMLLLMLIPAGFYAQPAGFSGKPPTRDSNAKTTVNTSTNISSSGSVSTFSTNPGSLNAPASISKRSGMDEFLKLLPVLVLAFGALIVFFLLVLIRRGIMDSDESIKIITIVLIITGLLFIVSSGTTPSTAVNTNLFAPAFGLLGSIAGYVFGRSVAVSKTHVATSDNSGTDKSTDNTTLSK